jgi:hypothetical protein
MSILDMLHKRHPKSTKDSKHARIWQFDNLTTYSAFLQEAIAYVVSDGHTETLTGIVDAEYYGFAFAKPGSHISIKPEQDYYNDYINLTVKIEVLFPDGKID